MINGYVSRCTDGSHTKTFIDYKITISNYPLACPIIFTAEEEFCRDCDRQVLEALLGENKVKFSIKTKERKRKEYKS